MSLLLDSKYKITLDSSAQNLQLEKFEDVKSKTTGEITQKWNILGYHGLSLRSALLGYQKHRIADMIAVENIEASQLISDITKLENEIKKISKHIVLEIKNDKQTVWHLQGNEFRSLMGI